jgi:apolipoprotein D and lipocalin family protein
MENLPRDPCSKKQGGALRKLILRSVFIVIMVIMILSSCGGNMANIPQPVASVDLNRYMGKWYEIAKIPNRFQKKCVRGTTAEYNLRKDGTVMVVNSCLDHNGKQIMAKGIAKVIDPVTNAKLQVSFVRILGVNLFWGDYWILGLDSDYQYAIVGVPNRKYGWILGRKPELSGKRWVAVKNILKNQGYEFQVFEKTRHLRRE